MEDIEIKYDKWCEDIANSRSTKELITHFREHVSDHYNRHNREGKDSLDIWMIGVLNFMNIFGKKFDYLNKEDLLYKLGTFHKNNPGGSEPPFDLDEFLNNYNGDIKKYHQQIIKMRKKSLEKLT